MDRIEKLWFELMSYSLRTKKLFITLEKHINSKDKIILLAKVSSIKNKRGVICSKHGQWDSIDLYEEIKKFIDSYDNSNYGNEYKNKDIGIFR